MLPGNIQAVTEAPILSRATGYIRKRYVDIGDRVKAGQVVAEVEAPELDQQILQANATIEQAKSSVQQAEAAIQQGRANENLARLTAGRMSNLLGRGVFPNRITTTRRHSTPRNRPTWKPLGRRPPPCAAASTLPKRISPG